MITTAIIVILVVVIVVLLLSLLKYACFVWCDVGSKARAAQCWHSVTDWCVDMDWMILRRLVCSSERRRSDLSNDTMMKNPIVLAVFLERKVFSVHSVAIAIHDLRQFAERATVFWVQQQLKQCKSVIYLCVSVCWWISMQEHFLWFGIVTISLGG